jgi:hypothetical protein
MGILRGKAMPKTAVGGASKRPAARVCRLSALLTVAALVTGCSSTLSSLPPALGGLPADTPAAPADQQKLAYPAVHDMPPPRQSTVLTPEELKKVEAEMVLARERQTKQAKQPAKNE